MPLKQANSHITVYDPPELLETVPGRRLTVGWSAMLNGTRGSNPLCCSPQLGALTILWLETPHTTKNRTIRTA